MFSQLKKDKALQQANKVQEVDQSNETVKQSVADTQYINRKVLAAYRAVRRNQIQRQQGGTNIATYFIARL